MTTFHAVLIDETGCDFGVDIDAASKAEAYAALQDDYPESRVEQIESREDTAAREHATYDLIRRGADFDDEGRPFFPNGDLDDDYED